MENIPITFMVTVYNEEYRIKNVLEHAVKWADEILVLNKSSTDKTKDICLSFGEKVKVCDIPFSLSSQEKATDLYNLNTNKWVFVGTASEIPTRNLIKKIKEKLKETDGELDLIYVPRRMFSFGINSPESPWYVNHYPFLINKEKTIISDKIHNNYSPKNPENTYTIPYSEDCCVYHLTHLSAKDYMDKMTQYFISEANGCTDPDAKIEECFYNIAKFEKKIKESDPDMLGPYCAWPIYWLGTAMFIWEKYRGIDVQEFYKKLKDDLIKNDWNSNIDSEEKNFVPDTKLYPKWVFNGEMRLTEKPDSSFFNKIKNSKIYNSNRIIRGFFKLGKKVLSVFKKKKIN